MTSTVTAGQAAAAARAADPQNLTDQDEAAEKIAAALASGATRDDVPAYVGLAAYRAEGGYRTFVACRDGERTPDDVIAMLEDSALRGLGGASEPPTEAQ